MHHLTFWEAHDIRFNAVVVQGYEIHYKETYAGIEPKYNRLRKIGQFGTLVEI